VALRESWARAMNWLGLRTLVPPTSGGWIDVTPASSPSWFQQDVRVRPETALSFPPVYSCVTLIANDIGKLRTRLMSVDENGIWKETVSAAFSPVLRKPNRYQNHIQFKQWWIISKLLHGNSYALKQRDGRGVVVALYLLDPAGVAPLVAPDGSVFYQLNPDNLTGLEQTTIIVPADEIIHDRMNCLFHPLVGVPPLYSAGMSADQGLQIQKDSSNFFKQGAKPSGILTAPAAISDENAKRVREYWNENFTGDKAGRVAVVGDGLKYEPIRMTSVDAQATEQLKLTAEMVAQAFHVPAFKIGIGSLPAGQKVGDMNQIYYTDCLQTLIEEFELAMDEGLALPASLRTELELSNLLRMDESTQAEVLGKLVGGGVMSPNEARERVNLTPLEGGDTVYMQQQDIPLEQARLNVVQRPDVTPGPALSEEDQAAINEAKAYIATQKAIAAMRKTMEQANV
jgi:HK97 family phage portal protein